MSLENVAVLFTDMVGSTALASSVAAETADEVRRQHFSVLRQAVAESGGTEVKNLGDGLMVVFGSASAAMACAVAMQRGVERDNRASRHPVGLRVGLSGGETAAEEDDYFGDPVVEAARLCAECEAGQILAADVVRLMAGRRSRFECRPLGSLELKGLPDPVATVEVVWPSSDGEAADGVPLPARLAVRPAIGLVGREPQLEQLAAALKQVAVGDGRQVVLVSGEAGLGKTTLAAEAARAAFEDGACVLFGHCEEDLATPYQLFAEALGHWVTHADEADLRSHVAAHGGELAGLVPALRSRIEDLPPSRATDAETERSLLFGAVLGQLATISAERPVVLVLDDLQWADPASLQLLRHLVASGQTIRVLVIGTYRESELSRSHPLLETLAAFHRQAGVSSIELTGLDDAQVVAVLASAAGHDLDDAGVGLAHAVYRETDGNPFFVTEVLRHLAETGAIRQDASGRWATDASLDQVALPESVRVVIGARVGRLGSEAERALSMAAVIGRDFDLDLLARATEVDEDSLLDVLDAASGAALVNELADAGQYQFTHALIQRTLYDDLGPSRRARAHRRVAEALEELCGGRPGARVGELARHWMQATQPIDLAKAVDYSRQAGDAALRALAPADAARHYEAALRLLDQLPADDAGLGLDLAILLGTAQRQLGDPTFRTTLLDAARRADAAGDVDRLAAAALANSRGMVSSVAGIDAEKVAILERTIELLPADHPARSLSLATLCSEVQWDSPFERRQALADEAVALAEASRDDATIVRSLNLIHLSLDIPRQLGPSLARTADALERAERLGDPVLIFWAAQWRAETAAKAGDVDEVDRCLELRRPLVEELDRPGLSWFEEFTRSWRAQIAGDPDEAEAHAVRAFELGTTAGEPDAELDFGIQLIGVAWQRGSMGDLAPTIEHEVAENPHLPGFRSTLAVSLIEADRTEDAQRLLDEFSETGFDFPLDQSWVAVMANYAEVAIKLRDASAGGPLFDRIVPYRGQIATLGAAIAQCPVSHYLGGLAHVLGRHDDADTYFAEAAAMSERMAARFFAASTDLAWGQMLAERDGPGDRERARVLLAKARTAAADNGYGAIERRSAQALHGVS